MLNEEERERLLANAAALQAAGITDTEARNAIDGYLQAALFTANDDEGALEGRGFGWSLEAQAHARDAVVDFITDRPALCQNFAGYFGSDGWLQVGIDLLFTRNGEGAGFWSRAVPEEIRMPLSEAATKLPPLHVQLDDNGELAFI